MLYWGGVQILAQSVIFVGEVVAVNNFIPLLQKHQALLFFLLWEFIVIILALKINFGQEIHNKNLAPKLEITGEYSWFEHCQS